MSIVIWRQNLFLNSLSVQMCTLNFMQTGLLTNRPNVVNNSNQETASFVLHRVIIAWIVARFRKWGISWSCRTASHCPVTDLVSVSSPHVISKRHRKEYGTLYLYQNRLTDLWRTRQTYACKNEHKAWIKVLGYGAPHDARWYIHISRPRHGQCISENNLIGPYLIALST